MEARYSPSAKHCYETLGSPLPIGVWVETVAIPSGLLSRDNAYNPINVKVSVNSQAPLRYVVHPERSDWYEMLQKAVGKTIRASDTSAIEIKDYLGNELKSMDRHDLERVIDCNAYVGGQLYWTNSTKLEVPTFMRSDKHMAVDKRISAAFNRLIPKISDVLASTNNVVDLYNATKPGGKLHSTIERAAKHIAKPEFVREHADGDRAANADHAEMAKHIADRCLELVRSKMKTSPFSEDIAQSYSHENLSVMKEVLGLEAPAAATNGWSVFNRVGAAVFRDDPVLLRDLRTMLTRHDHVTDSLPINNAKTKGAMKTLQGLSGMSQAALPVSDPMPYCVPHLDQANWWKGRYYNDYGVLVESPVKVGVRFKAPPVDQVLDRHEYVEAIRYSQLFSGGIPCPLVEGLPSYIKRVDAPFPVDARLGAIPLYPEEEKEKAFSLVDDELYSDFLRSDQNEKDQLIGDELYDDISPLEQEEHDQFIGNAVDESPYSDMPPLEKIGGPVEDVLPPPALIRLAKPLRTTRDTSSSLPKPARVAAKVSSPAPKPFKVAAQRTTPASSRKADLSDMPRIFSRKGAMPIEAPALENISRGAKAGGWKTPSVKMDVRLGDIPIGNKSTTRRARKPSVKKDTRVSDVPIGNKTPVRRAPKPLRVVRGVSK